MSDKEYQKLILGPRYAVKLEDLEERHLLRLVCFVCRHSSIVLPSELLKRWPPYTSLMTLEARMICRRCGNRLENRWEVVTGESKGAASLHEKGVGESINE